MNALLDQAWVLAQPEIMQMGQDLGESLWSQFKGLVNEAAPSAREVAALFKQAAVFKAQAITTKDPEQKQMYADAVTTTIRRAKTVALAEGVVATDQAAAWLEAAATATINGLEIVGEKMLTMVFTALLNAATGGSAAGAGGLVSAAMSLIKGK